MAGELPGDELFVGQMIALTPIESLEGDALARAQLTAEPTGPAPRRRETFSIVMYAPRHGLFLLGPHEIEVSIGPLDLDTPPEALIFRIVSVSGRSLRVTRAVSDAPPTVAD